jgi:hypothetical protein
MNKMMYVAVAALWLAGTSQMALAQNGSVGGPNGNPAYNAGHSGGDGTHVGAERTGSASNDQKVIHNRNGYTPGRQ